MILPCLFSILFIALIVFRVWYNSAKQKGIRGEKKVANILEELSDEYYIINDVILPTNNGTTQIDHLVVSKYGVFVIETKNYRGDIYGSDYQENWTQIIVTEVRYKRNPFKVYTYVTKNQFYNPVKQALGHVYSLKNLLKEYKYLPIVPIVAFVGDANLGKVDRKQNVVYEDDLLNVIRKYKTTYLPEKEVVAVVAKVQNNNEREIVNNKQHINNIKQSQRMTKEHVAVRICPKCGGQLIERQGPYSKFLGCSNYPKCRYIAKIK